MIKTSLRDQQKLPGARSNWHQEAQTPPRQLKEKEINQVLSHLSGWSRQGNKLHRQYHFGSFEKALGFLSGLALVAHEAGHPLEETEVYDCVTVDLTSPDVGGITDVDVELAHKADALATSLQNSKDSATRELF